MSIQSKSAVFFFYRDVFQFLSCGFISSQFFCIYFFLPHIMRFIQIFYDRTRYPIFSPYHALRGMCFSSNVWCIISHFIKTFYSVCMYLSYETSDFPYQISLGWLRTNMHFFFVGVNRIILRIRHSLIFRDMKFVWKSWSLISSTMHALMMSTTNMQFGQIAVSYYRNVTNSGELTFKEYAVSDLKRTSCMLYGYISSIVRDIELSYHMELWGCKCWLKPAVWI